MRVPPRCCCYVKRLDCVRERLDIFTKFCTFGCEPVDLCLQAYERALQPKALSLVRGGHFTPYIEHFEQTSRVAAEWFGQHL